MEKQDPLFMTAYAAQEALPGLEETEKYIESPIDDDGTPNQDALIAIVGMRRVA